MITLTTGTPGAGKSLWTISKVEAERLKSGRAVYYNGIADLALPWIELDKPEDWLQCPVGSIIVLDECQRLFRPRGTGSQVPVYVQALETHRHNGLDLWLVTQHPMLIESNVRRLTERHYHVMRAFGMKRATVHEFNMVKTEPDKSRSDSQRHEWAYPKEAFSWYKSAELHTHKARIPMRVWIMLAAFIVAGLAIWQFVAWNKKHLDKAKAPADMVSGQSPGGSAVVTGTVKPRDWMAEQLPRISGLPYTAPVYDEATKAQHPPRPQVIVMHGECRAYTQQATRIAMGDALCRQILNDGLYIAWDDKSAQGAAGETGLRSSRETPASTAPPALPLSFAPTAQAREESQAHRIVRSALAPSSS